jgi:hypothetical protein
VRRSIWTNDAVDPSEMQGIDAFAMLAAAGKVWEGEGWPTRIFTASALPLSTAPSLSLRLAGPESLPRRLRLATVESPIPTLEPPTLRLRE